MDIEVPTKRCKMAKHIMPGECVVMSPGPDRMVATVKEVSEDPPGTIHIRMAMGQVETWIDLGASDWLEIGG